MTSQSRQSEIQVIEDPGLVPMCPYCNAQLHTVLARELPTSLGKRYIYACSGCKKALGVSHRKGFWMG
jgi:uncharacterized protein with PIN domain